MAGRKRVVPEDAYQCTVHLLAGDLVLLERIRESLRGTPGERMPPKSAVLRDALAIGLRLLAKELNVPET